MLLSFDLHQTILCFFAAVSLLGNALLITLILQAQCRFLGNYRWLLLAFSLGDIVISLYHAYAVPTYLQIEFGCVAFTWAGLHKPPTIGFILNTTYCVLFYEPFVLLTFHFLYRYYMLAKPDLINNHPWMCGMFVIVANVIFSCMIVLSSVILDKNSDEDFFGVDLLLHYGVNTSAVPRPNLIPINFVHLKKFGGGINWNTITAICNSGIAAVITISINIACSIGIMNQLKIVDHKISRQTRQLQGQLFNALLVQFFVPFILCFIPFTLLVALPLTGIRFGEAGNVFANTVSTFPAVDAFLVIGILGRFRMILIGWVARVFPCCNLQVGRDDSRSETNTNAPSNNSFEMT